MEIPVQYFQSVIAIELAVAGALLFQIHYFEPREVAEAKGRRLAHPWVRLLMALVLGTTVFGSLYAMSSGGHRTAAMAVTVGLAVSVLPILLRVLPAWKGSRADTTATITGLVVYAIVVAGFVVLLNAP